MNRVQAHRQRHGLVVGLFVGIVAAQVLLAVVSLEILSSVRSFVAGESLWSKAQRDAVLHLREFIATRSEADYQAFLAAVAVTRGDRQAREELDKPLPDATLIERGFAIGGLHPADIPGMSRLYRWGRDTPLMVNSVAIWVQADAAIDELVALMEKARMGLGVIDPGDPTVRTIRPQLLDLNARLTRIERRFSDELGDASRRIKALLLIVNLLLAGGLTVIGARFAMTTFRDQRVVDRALRSGNQRWELAASVAHLEVFDWSLVEEHIMLDERAWALTGIRLPDSAAALDQGRSSGSVHPEDAERVRAEVRCARTDRQPFRLRCRIITEQGSVRHMELSGSVHDADEEGDRMVCLLRDVSDDVRAETAIRRQAAQQGLIARFGQLALDLRDVDELVANAVSIAREGLDVELCRLLVAGIAVGSLRMAAGTGWSAAWTGDHVYDAVEETGNVLLAGSRDAFFVGDYDHQTATQVPVSAALRAHDVRSGVAVLVCGASEPYGVLGVFAQDPHRFNEESANFLQSIAHALAAAIDRRTTEDRLSRMAQFDALTGLPNRGAYLERLSQTLSQAERENGSFGVLFIDVDRFKLINDTYGHEVGDRVLVQISRRLQDSLRQVDVVGRLGGDEFAVTMGHLSKVEDAALVAQKLIAALSSPLVVNGQDVSVSASIGIAIWPMDGADPGTLLNNADTAMYRAKESGRNAYQFYLPQMNERVAERARTETQLRLALERGEFILNYQPKACLATGTISGFEALLRWQHPEYGIVAPADFIGILEDTGLIVQVGEWVIAEVCRNFVAWKDAGIDLRPVAINLSGRQFRQSNLDKVIEGILTSTGVDPSLLEFELTESVLMGDGEAAVLTLKNMRALGVRLSVDDFGTGYSSLAYLQRFPLDCLKIDRTFIRDLSTDANDSTIAIAIINLAKSLKLHVVAEGVETQEQLDFLRLHECDEVQGYYFCKPLSLAECTSALTSNKRLQPRAVGNAAAANELPIRLPPDSAERARHR